MTVTVVPMSVGLHVIPGDDNYRLAMAAAPSTFVRKLSIEKKRHAVVRGFGCIRSPQTSVTIDVQDRSTSTLIFDISASWLDARLDGIGSVLPTGRAVIEFVDPTVMFLAEKIRAVPGNSRNALGLEGITDSLIMYLAWRHGENRWRPAEIGTRRLYRLLDYIEHHLSETLSLDDLAKVAGVSRFGFARSFTRWMGISPHRYVMTRRANAAVSLIREGGLALADIAAMIGFYDQAHMSRWISREIGISPARVAKAAFS